jgi:hypothetical protein
MRVAFVEQSFAEKLFTKPRNIDKMININLAAYKKYENDSLF